MKVLHSWLKEYVGDALPDPAVVAERLTFSAFEVEEVLEIGTEAVIDVDVLPNRASDALCHRGIARELATILDTPLVQDPLQEAVALPQTKQIEVTIDDAAYCPRFTANLVTGVTVAPSPAWLQERLHAIGQRPINNIVDATNYVMYAIGQPLHAYDADRLACTDGTWRLGVRKARPDETVALLAEGEHDADREVALTGTELLIVDGNNDTPLGLAGIKGGRHAEIHEGTKNIIIEAANFDPASIRQTARRFGIMTDASKRFENAPARALPVYAQQMIADLIADIAGGTTVGLADAYPGQLDAVPVTVRTGRVNALLGLALTPDMVRSIIERIGASVTEESEPGVFTVLPPWERKDLTIEADYVEEIGRIHGLNSIEGVLPEAVPLREVSARQYYSEQVRQALIGAGFSEVITSSFLKKGKIQLQNALASDKSYVRHTLTKNLTTVLDANIGYTDLLGISDVRVFELGTIFTKDEQGVTEYLALALGARTKGNGYHPQDDALVEEGCAAVAEALGIDLDWQRGKGVAELNFSAVLEQLPAPQAYQPLPQRAPVTFQTISPYPPVARDIALWVGADESAETVRAVLTGAAGDLCVRQTLFDTYHKEEQTSYAFRLVFQSHIKTLTDDEVNTIMDKVYETAKKHGWEVR